MKDKGNNSKLILYISLGCFGNKDDDFVICPSIKNNIYALYSDNIFYEDIMAFLDKCKLFDNPHYDFNTIKNFLSIFKGKFFSPLQLSWNERKYKNYVKFCVDHKDCGLILQLLPVTEKLSENTLNQPSSQKEDEIFLPEKNKIEIKQDNLSKNKKLILLKNKK